MYLIALQEAKTNMAYNKQHKTSSCKKHVDASEIRMTKQILFTLKISFTKKTVLGCLLIFYIRTISYPIL